MAADGLTRGEQLTTEREQRNRPTSITPCQDVDGFGDRSRWQQRMSRMRHHKRPVLVFHVRLCRKINTTTEGGRTPSNVLSKPLFIISPGSDEGRSSNTIRAPWCTQALMKAAGEPLASRSHNSHSGGGKTSVFCPSRNIVTASSLSARDRSTSVTV